MWRCNFQSVNLIILLCLDTISLFLRLSQSAIITPVPRLSFLKFLFSFQRFLTFSTPVDFVDQSEQENLEATVPVAPSGPQDELLCL